ncbi:hypothetical protein HDV02_000082 [Globomyces sp. JEL0801]|nr:hypothetical protein HDV02_000082 [Globomyces sp. JEL0801]
MTKPNFPIPNINFKEFQNHLSKDFVYHIRIAIQEHGIVKIDNIKLTPQEYLDLSKAIGETINLPDFLAPAKVPGYPELSRVCNFDLEQEKVDVNYAFGNYWHHDGNFWERGQHHIINGLHSKVVPEKGGATGLLNTMAAYDALTKEQKQNLEHIEITVNPANIEDFRNVPEEVTQGLLRFVKHKVVQQSDGKRSLYVPYTDEILMIDSKPVLHEQLFELVDHDEFKYIHYWNEDQIIFWDNLKFMHKAMGDIEGKRLLWRSQARVESIDQ